MKTPKNRGIPKNMLKNLVQDVKKLMITNEGKLFLLEIFEEIPPETRGLVIESLVVFHDPEILDFFYLIKQEYGKEYEEACNYGIKKITFAGAQSGAVAPAEKYFYKAYATCSRHTGKITIDVAWHTAKDVLQVDGFYLTCNSEGIHSFFLAERMSIRDYEKDRKQLPDMMEISYEETCFLIQESFRFNTLHMTRPALGRFIYQDYLTVKHGLKKQEIKKLLLNITPRQSPRQLINSFFYAMKNQDLHFVLSILEPDFWKMRDRKTCPLKDFLQPGTFTLEAQVNEMEIRNDRADVNAYIIRIRDREVYYCDYGFVLQKNKLTWSIKSIVRKKNEKITPEFNPFTQEVSCRAYNILDLDELLSLLEQEDNIRGMEELPYGIHMRYSLFEDTWGRNLASLSGLVVDLVINGNEFVIIAEDPKHFCYFENLLKNEMRPLVAFQGAYKLSLFSIYNYLGGHYLSLEDLLHEDHNNPGFEEYMRFLTVHYLVKDHDAVKAKLEDMNHIRFSLSATTKLYYQKESQQHPGFMAEFIIGDGWLTLSAFGEKDLVIARKSFEKGMHEYLEFEGLEIKNNGIFEILTPDLKKRNPELEPVLKEMYLNKWIHSRMAFLEGMTPSEASESEAGSRLLWTMLKKIRDQEDKKRKRSGKHKIYINEYLGKLEQKKQGKC